MCQVKPSLPCYQKLPNSVDAKVGSRVVYASPSLPSPYKMESLSAKKCVGIVNPKSKSDQSTDKVKMEMPTKSDKDLPEELQLCNALSLLKVNKEATKDENLSDKYQVQKQSGIILVGENSSSAADIMGNQNCISNTHKVDVIASDEGWCKKGKDHAHVTQVHNDSALHLAKANKLENAEITNLTDLIGGVKLSPNSRHQQLSDVAANIPDTDSHIDKLSSISPGEKQMLINFIKTCLIPRGWPKKRPSAEDGGGVQKHQKPISDLTSSCELPEEFPVSFFVTPSSVLSGTENDERDYLPHANLNPNPVPPNTLVGEGEMVGQNRLIGCGDSHSAQGTAVTSLFSNAHRDFCQPYAVENAAHESRRANSSLPPISPESGYHSDGPNMCSPPVTQPDMDVEAIVQLCDEMFDKNLCVPGTARNLSDLMNYLKNDNHQLHSCQDNNSTYDCTTASRLDASPLGMVAESPEVCSASVVSYSLESVPTATAYKGPVSPLATSTGCLSSPVLSAADLQERNLIWCQPAAPTANLMMSVAPTSATASIATSVPGRPVKPQACVVPIQLTQVQVRHQAVMASRAVQVHPLPTEHQFFFLIPVPQPANRYRPIQPRPEKPDVQLSCPQDDIAGTAAQPGNAARSCSMSSDMDVIAHKMVRIESETEINQIRQLFLESLNQDTVCKYNKLIVKDAEDMYTKRSEPKGWSILHEAVAEINREMIWCMTDHYLKNTRNHCQPNNYIWKSLDHVARNGQTPLQMATGMARTDIASYLVASGADPNTCHWCNDGHGEPTGDAPLHVAVTRGDTATINALCKFRRTDVDVMNFDGYTPLHLAVKVKGRETSLALVDLLLNYGANINLQNDKDGMSALHYAVDRVRDMSDPGDMEHMISFTMNMVSKLSSQPDADFDLVTRSGDSVLDYAVTSINARSKSTRKEHCQNICLL
ncbi:PREDICTED: uncharacterized protein LOC106812062 isoform X2 [Priapulus caudatus]|uniref:Uncharacterized protein LOC106812062 isoform X2 n=1 Tax=Priapulus caudatus TaxID=37621 RepID=A0ABM1EGJ3_PRICU|nr:PREDICTED: uncharacterized protein LOC106812062 isoform X2 [Priapulus caudatus]